MNLLKATAVAVVLAVPAGAQTVGNPAMNAPSAQNSGTGIAGQPGNKNGPAARSGQDQNASSQQDTSKIPGKPGGKSGPAVMPPSHSAQRH
jgi:hypothetical protein